MRRRSLIDLIANNLDRDPGDAPTVHLEADVMADDMQRYAPDGVEPTDRPVPINPAGWNSGRHDAAAARWSADRSGPARSDLDIHS